MLPTALAQLLAGRRRPARRPHRLPRAAGLGACCHARVPRSTRSRTAPVGAHRRRHPARGRASRSLRGDGEPDRRRSPSEVGIATGINTVMRTVGGSFGAAVVTAILTPRRRSPLPDRGAYTAAFAFSSGAGVLALLGEPPRAAPGEAGQPRAGPCRVTLRPPGERLGGHRLQAPVERPRDAQRVRLGQLGALAPNSSSTVSRQSTSQRSKWPERSRTCMCSSACGRNAPPR